MASMYSASARIIGRQTAGSTCAPPPQDFEHQGGGDARPVLAGCAVEKNTMAFGGRFEELPIRRPMAVGQFTVYASHGPAARVGRDEAILEDGIGIAEAGFCIEFQ